MEPRAIPPSTRRHVLARLGPEGRKLAAQLLDGLVLWSPIDLVTVRLIAESAERLDALRASQATPKEQRAEARVFLSLAKALRLQVEEER